SIREDKNLKRISRFLKIFEYLKASKIGQIFKCRHETCTEDFLFKRVGVNGGQVVAVDPSSNRLSHL
ncbi:8274_t:CDS:1, partial [Paraglomus brasilianum]